MIPNVKPSQVYPVAAEIAPQSVAAAANVTTAWTQIPPGSKWIAIQFLAGILGGGSVQLDLLQATSAAGAGSKAAATNLATNATSSTYNQVEASVDQVMDLNNGFSYIQARLSVTGGTGSLVAAALAFGPNEFMA